MKEQHNKDEEQQYEDDEDGFAYLSQQKSCKQISTSKRGMEISVSASAPKRARCNADSETRTTIQDSLYGQIPMHPLCAMVMDTPEFQRLRGLKQLGLCDRVFPTATHTRFEHCLGVMHLAGAWAKHYQEKQPYLGITDIDVLCVQLAGLIHDLGHGPFSHVFDNVFLPRARAGLKWTHEDMSCDIFRRMLANLEDAWRRWLDDDDVEFILQCVQGRTEGDQPGGRFFSMHAGQAGLDKGFLYDIVSNSWSGLDVDKLDYFVRDSGAVGKRAVTHDADRLKLLSRVGKERAEGSKLMICFPEKTVKEVLEVFKTRFTLHAELYTHRTVKCVELMLVDCLVAAEDEGFTVRGRDGGRCKVSDAVDDMEAYVGMSDSVLQLIADMGDELPTANNLLRRLACRDLYKIVGRSRPMTDAQVANLKEQGGVKQIKKELLKQLQEEGLQDLPMEEDIEVLLHHIHHGKKGNNPVDSVLFFNPKQQQDPRQQLPCAFRTEESSYQSFLPRHWQEQCVQVFCCRQQHKAPIRSAFEKWCKVHCLPEPLPSQQSYSRNSDDECA